MRRSFIWIESDLMSTFNLEVCVPMSARFFSAVLYATPNELIETFAILLAILRFPFITRDRARSNIVLKSL